MKQELSRGPGLQTNVSRSIKKLEHSPKTHIEILLSGLGPQSEMEMEAAALLACGRPETYTGHIRHYSKGSSQMLVFLVHPGKDQQVLILQKLL